ncbi:amidohydrolase family protein (plasmid) [Rhizorhabdus wittichii]|uniref:Amidohydrolase family protein n=1 Tax=Rhizorhabdus wittichii TaxID=160791 RepID=A0A975HGY9_9SPHN|nr:amidohydrolase family protein [Rhizorhabdus wittichii]QTH24990.1 amidohydrolase family protein [Rhizorhabdus wittichii]
MSTQFDLVIRGGTIVDGTGTQPYIADVGVRDGLIVEVGSLTGTGREEIDASGLTVTPGFVDIHTHYDGQITWENRMIPSSNHGVTTIVMGNCGVGFAPVREGDHHLMIKLMEGVEDIPEVVMAEGVPFNWKSFPDYLDVLEQRECDVDFATQIPHSPLRVFVMGERGANLEPPTSDDLVEMRRCVAEAVQAGALGVASSRNLFHRFRSGKLAPSVNTEVDEILALAQGLTDAGTGVFQCNPNLDNDARDEMAVFRTIAETTGRPVNFSLIHMPNDATNWHRYIEGIRQARADGLTISGQFLPRPLGVLYGLDLSFNPFSLNPSYRAIAGLPLAEKVARLRDPELRARLIAEEPDDPSPSFVGMIKSISSLYRLTDPVRYDFRPENSLQAEAERLGRPEREVIYDALLEDEGRAILASFATDILPYLDKSAVLFGEENLIPALGDGGAHYGMVCDAAYTTYLLSCRVGDRGLDLPTAVRSLTSQPARSVGLADRGVVAAGYKADLNVLDLDAMMLRRPQIKADLPAGGKRLSQQSTGYVATVVSGAVTYRNGEASGALPGRLIRGTRNAPSEPAPAQYADA